MRRICAEFCSARQPWVLGSLRKKFIRIPSSIRQEKVAFMSEFMHGNATKFSIIFQARLVDELTIDDMKTRLATENNRVNSMVETIVTSPQFLNIRGRDFDARPE